MTPYVASTLNKNIMGMRSIVTNHFGSRPEIRMKTSQTNFRIQERQPVEREFPCDVSFGKSKSVPESVDELRPGDISVVAALGDSLTCAFGAAATNLMNLFVENRGLSWSIGGEGTWREYLTVPNLLKEFNPQLVGFSKEDSPYHWPSSEFNLSELMAMHIDLLYMAQQLVKRLSNDSRVDFERDWKLVTILIGSNDYCFNLCDGITSKSHTAHLESALDFLSENLPRAFVNLVVSPNLGELKEQYKGLPPHCWFTHRLMCPCIYGDRYRENFNKYKSIMDQIQEEEQELAKKMKYRKKDFAVVAQPFTQNFKFPEVTDTRGVKRTDLSYISLDCHHLSQKGNAIAANGLWNNMFEPAGNKSDGWKKEFQFFRCPTKNQPYLFTYNNSRSNSNTTIAQ